MIGARLTDDAGRDDRASNEGTAAHHRFAPENRYQPIGVVHPILQ